MYEAYARRLLEAGDCPKGAYHCHELTDIAMQLPFGEAHMAARGMQERDLLKLGYGRPLATHMQECFFNLLKGGEIVLMTTPVLIEHQHLSSLQHWREWQVLAVHLLQFKLEPVVVFRNKAHKFSEGLFYVADVRVIFSAEEPYVYE